MIAEIIVDIAHSEVDKIFDYLIPESMRVMLGQRVYVPFGNRRIEGYVVNIKDTSTYDNSKLKAILKVADEEPVILPEMLELAKYMVKKYNVRVVDVIRLCVPSSMRKDKIKPKLKETVFLSENFNKEEALKNVRANAKSQIALLEYMAENKKSNRTFLNKAYSSSAVKKFADLGFFECEIAEDARDPLKQVTKIENKQVVLTEEQQKAVNKILTQNGKTVLLHGVTGSGKTEVYMRVISEVQKQNKTAILLVPEISLTPQVLQNFYARFGEEIAILHSGLSVGEKFDEWRKIRAGKAKIVVGARSAIFAPISNIGAIIIDEEHDGSYFSETNPRYYTHEVANFRAKVNNCPVVLGSATPSVNSYNKALNGKYTLIELTKRANNKAMPEISVVNMAMEMRSGNNSVFSADLLKELQEVIDNKNQAMIFINRRGYSSFLRCKECGYVAKCTDCDVSLVYHREDNQLKCHFCGKRFKAITACPECKSTYIRQGNIGTQRLVEELKDIFPDVKVLRMDNDTTSGKNAHQKILDEFSNSKPAILVGTQMIAKGHDFPNVTLVGIIDADLSLHFSDYRAHERTFQLITQVAGRAGRSDKEGKVILQTYTPNHYVYRFVKTYNYKSFFNKESNMREVTKFPPFSKIVRILLTSENEDLARSAVLEYNKHIKDLKQRYNSDFIYVEAMKSPIKRVKNKYRYQILMRFNLENSEEIIQEIYKIENNLKTKRVLSFVEINPQNLS